MKEHAPTGRVYELRPGGPERSAGHIRAGEYIAAEADWRWQRPALPNFEFYLLAGGTGSFRFAGCEQAASEGDFLLIPPRAECEIARTGRGSMVLRYCHFDFGPHGLGHTWGSWDALAHFLHGIDAEGALARERRLLVPAYLPLDPDPDILGAHDEIMRLAAELPWAGRAALYGRLLLFLAEISRRFAERAALLPGRAGAEEARTSRHVARALRFINTHLSDPISLREVSEALELNDDYLGRLFREATGETVGAYILRRKMATAKAGLLAGGKSVKEIAAGLGFADQRYFARQFRKSEGISPSKYLQARIDQVP